MKNIRTAKESRLTYTANGIKGKNGEIISTWGELSYLPAYYDFDPVRLEIRLTVKDYKQLRIIPNGCNVRNDSDGMTDYYENDFKNIDEYSPIIRHANESLYNCGMIDDIITV